ncbi:MAG: hypothetical protein DELT_00342 [Desulfovibrio sp.]
MDTVTHLVAGALTPLAFKNAPKTRALTLFGIVCGEFPDIDVLAGNSAEALLAFHRGITHSVFLQPVFALFLAFIFHRFLKKGDGNGTWSFRKTWTVALLALYIHLFLDCMTTFGTQIFMPFSQYRVALPAMYIVDLALTLPLIAAWIYAIRKNRSRAAGNGAPIAQRALAWLFAYPILALCLNYTAANSLEKRYAVAGNALGIEKVELSPEPFAPFNWKAIGITPETYHMARFFTPTWNADLTFTQYPRPEPELVAHLRREVPLFRMYDDFASYLFTRQKMTEDGSVLHIFRDVRYEATLPGLIAAAGRSDGIFIMEVKTAPDNRSVRGYRFLDRGNDAASRAWETPQQERHAR